MKKKNTQVTKCFCLYLYGYPWYFALNTDNSQLKNTITRAIPATHITATHTNNISIVQGTKVTCVIIYESICGQHTFSLANLQVRGSSFTQHHHSHGNSSIWHKGQGQLTKQLWSLRIDLKVQQRETKRQMTFGIKSVRTYNQGYWKAERCASRRRTGLDCCRGYNSETHFNIV